MQGKKLSSESLSWSKENVGTSFVYYYLCTGLVVAVAVFLFLPRISAG